MVHVSASCFMSVNQSATGFCCTWLYWKYVYIYIEIRVCLVGMYDRSLFGNTKFTRRLSLIVHPCPKAHVHCNYHRGIQKSRASLPNIIPNPVNQNSTCPGLEESAMFRPENVCEKHAFLSR